MSDYFRKPTEEWALHVEGNLGFAWSEALREMRVVLLIPGCEVVASTPKRKPKKQRVTEPRLKRVRQKRWSVVRTQADRDYRARKQAAEKTARAQNRAAKAEKIARIMKEKCVV